MKWFSWLTKVDPQKIFDTVSKGIDNLSFTKEEKAEFNKEVIKANLDFVKSTLCENSARSLTRRYIAVSVVSFELLLSLGAIILYNFNTQYALFIIGIVEYYSNVFLAIICFYFGSSMLRTYTNKKK